MRRREIAAHALKLQEKVEGIAKRYESASSVDDKMLDFGEVLFEVNSFYRNVAPSPSLKVFWLLEEFQGLIEDIREGRPSLADDFPKKPGQRMDILSETNLAACCAVMTGLMNGDMLEEEAAKKLAGEMSKSGLKFPPLRNTTRSKSDTTSAADKMKNWRDKLVSGEKGDRLRSVYDRHLSIIEGSTADEWRQNATNLLDIIGRRGARKTANSPR